MEDWEKEHIRQNLPELLKNTSCNSLLLGQLFSNSVLGDGDIAALTAIHNRHDKVYQFYEIVQMRVGSYSQLKTALIKCCQTGAWSILERCNRHNAATPFKNCGTITYSKKEVLGQGCYSTAVYKGQFENRIVAVKVISIHCVDVRVALKEVEVLSKLDGHPNVVRYYKTEVTEDFVLIALELCETNLHDWVTNPRTIEIGVVELLKQIAEGVEYLHSNWIVHRDLKPTNILMVQRGHGKVFAKISDFGLSRNIFDERSRRTAHSSGVGTEGWIAPEVAEQLDQETSSISVIGMSLATDIFALGCIFYFVLSEGSHPFGGPVVRQANILYRKHQLSLDKIKGMPDKALSFIWLIRHMLDHEQRDRPTASVVISHHVFWSSNKTLHFLEDIHPFIDCSSELIVKCADLVIEHDISQNMSSLFCPILKEYLIDTLQLHVDEIKLAHLYHLLVDMKKELSNLPQNVREVLGSDSDEFLYYWESHFPFLLPIAWTCFQFVKEQKHAMREYYHSSESKFMFRLVSQEDNSFAFIPFPIDKVPGAMTASISKFCVPHIKHISPDSGNDKQQMERYPEQGRERPVDAERPPSVPKDQPTEMKSDRNKIREEWIMDYKTITAEEKRGIVKKVEDLHRNKIEIDKLMTKLDDVDQDISLRGKRMARLLLQIAGFTRGHGPLKITKDVIMVSDMIYEAGVKFDSLIKDKCQGDADTKPPRSMTDRCRDLQSISKEKDFNPQFISNPGFSSLNKANSLLAGVNRVLINIAYSVKYLYKVPTKDPRQRDVVRPVIQQVIEQWV